MFTIAALTGDWLYALFMGAVIYFGFTIYKWWKNEGKKKWETTKNKFRILLLVLLSASVLLPVNPVFAGLQQVFVDGQAGRFDLARSELQKLSDNLAMQATSADITIVGRNCAAIGFYAMLSQIASDCISKKINISDGKKLFTAAQNAASGQLDQAASMAKDVADSNPNYSPAQLLLARIRMGICMQYNQRCSETIKIYRNALKRDKALAVAYLDLGMLYQHMGKNKEAIAILEAATNDAQGHIATKWAHLMLALLHSAENNGRRQRGMLK